MWKVAFRLHHPLCRVSIPLASGTDLSTFKPRTLQEAEGKLSKHCSCANTGPNPKIGFHFGIFWQRWTSFPSCQSPETWGTYCPTDEHKSKWAQISSDHMSFESTPISDTTCLPQTGLWETPAGQLLGIGKQRAFSSGPSGHTLRHIRKEPESATSLILGTTEFSCFMWNVLVQEVPGFQTGTRCVCLEHLALGNAHYLQPGNHNLKQPELLTPASSKMQNKQLKDSVRAKHLLKKYCPQWDTRATSPTDFISSLTENMVQYGPAILYSCSPIF